MNILFISTSRNALASCYFEAFLHSLSDMQICCLWCSLSLCTSDWCFWSFLTTKVCPYVSLRDDVLGELCMHTVSKLSVLCSGLYERKWKHTVPDIRGAEQSQLWWFVSTRRVPLFLGPSRPQGSAAGLIKQHHPIFNLRMHRANVCFESFKLCLKCLIVFLMTSIALDTN